MKTVTTEELRKMPVGTRFSWAGIFPKEVTLESDLVGEFYRFQGSIERLADGAFKDSSWIVVSTTAQNPPSPPSPYHRLIKGQWIDIYDIATAFGVTSLPQGEALKKLLRAGTTHKDRKLDIKEGLESFKRWVEIECGGEK